MSQYINKEYFKSGDKSCTKYTVCNVTPDFVEFTNGARCKFTTFINDFVDANKIMENMEQINPDTFFSKTISENDPLVSQIEQIAAGNAAGNNIGRRAQTSQVYTPSNANSRNIPTVQKPTIKNADGTEVKIPESMMRPSPQPQPQPYVAPNLFDENRNASMAQNQQMKTTPNPPEWDIFARVKKKDNLILQIPFKINIPSPQKIDALDDMFESSFIEYISDQFVEEFIAKHFKEIKKAISTEISNWVEDVIYNNKEKDGVRTISTPIETIVETIETEETITAEVNETKVEVDEPVVDEPVVDETKVEVDETGIDETVIDETKVEVDETVIDETKVEVDEVELRLDENGNIIITDD
jgi:hypothetical protein